MRKKLQVLLYTFDMLKPARVIIVIASVIVSAVAVYFLQPSPFHSAQIAKPANSRTEAKQSIARCTIHEDRESCMNNAYESYARNFGTKEALALIHDTIQKDPSFGGTCHNIMHQVGHVAVAEFGTFKEAYLHGNYDCGNGYYHGVVEEAMHGEEDSAFTPNRIRHFCDSVASPTTTAKDYAALNCAHGLGHALVYKAEGSLAAALPSCLYIEKELERGECVAGAFMENMIERLPTALQSDPIQNPSLTCSSIGGDVYRCWAALAGYVIAAQQHGTKEAVAFCLSFDSFIYRDACGEGIGKAVRIGREENKRASQIYCEAHTGVLSAACVQGSSRAGVTSSDSPLYSEAFGLLAWPSATATDPLIGKINMLQ